MGKTSEAQKEAVYRYNEKIYKRFLISLRKDEDKEIIEEIALASENGLTHREFLADVINKAKLWEQAQNGKYPIWLDNKEDSELIEQLKRVESKGIDRKEWLLSRLK